MTNLERKDPAAAVRANDDGMAAMARGDWRAAIKAFEAATAADWDAGSLWMNLAHACRLAQDSAGEKRALDRVLALDELDFGAQLRMAQWLQREGEETRALIGWSQVFQIASQLPRLPPALQAEIDAGKAYSESLQQRITLSIDHEMDLRLKEANGTERRRIQAFIDRALGRRQIYTNQCEGLHYPFLPADEYFDFHHFPWLSTLEAAASTIKAELAALLNSADEVLAPYVQLAEGSPTTPWSPLDGSLDWGACFLWKFGKPNQPILDRCPQTAALLEKLPLARIPGRAPNAFFSILRPNSHIPPHTGVTNTRAIIHLALDIPPNCGFRVGGETREWVEGKAFAFDDTIDHEAWNRSDRPRAILIIDCWNPHLSEAEREAIVAYCRVADTSLARPVL